MCIFGDLLLLDFYPRAKINTFDRQQMLVNFRCMSFQYPVLLVFFWVARLGLQAMCLLLFSF